jgi:hypothetical protein
MVPVSKQRRQGTQGSPWQPYQKSALLIGFPKML